MLINTPQTVPPVLNTPSGARRTRSAKSNWLIPTGLVLLSLVPVVAGTSRMLQLAGGAEVTQENARFFAAPLPVALHIATAAIFCVLGAFQFSPRFRNRNLKWHRMAGWILIPCGIVSALSGLWMTQFYPFVDFDGWYVYGMRLLAGTAMATSITLAVTAIRKRNIAQHRAWMMRGYALGIAAGTQVFTHLPWFVFPGIRGEFARSVFMGLGWAINIAVAEWFIARQRRRRSA